jgi:uncharacterized protein YbjT (DUF2867 family)
VDVVLKPVDGVITVPTGDGAEAFVAAEDIAAVAAATLARPDAHAGAQYAPTGPEALTVSDAADVIADVIGQPGEAQRHRPRCSTTSPAGRRSASPTSPGEPHGPGRRRMK